MIPIRSGPMRTMHAYHNPLPSCTSCSVALSPLKKSPLDGVLVSLALQALGRRSGGSFLSESDGLVTSMHHVCRFNPASWLAGTHLWEFNTRMLIDRTTKTRPSVHPPGERAPLLGVRGRG
jgi:hypothetical protein